MVSVREYASSLCLASYTQDKCKRGSGSAEHPAVHQETLQRIDVDMAEKDARHRQQRHAAGGGGQLKRRVFLAVDIGRACSVTCFHRSAGKSCIGLAATPAGTDAPSIAARITTSELTRMAAEPDTPLRK
jgi:hypothetical protein